MSKTSRWLMTIIICLALFAGLAAFKFFQIKAAIEFGESFPEPSTTVDIVTTAVESHTAYYRTVGIVVAPESITLQSELNGRIVELNLSPGGHVRKGQILVQQDVSEEAARLAAAEAHVRLMKLDLERATELRRQKTVSEERLNQAQANFDIAAAEVQALQAVIEKKTLRAPFDAVAGLHDLEIGEYLHPQQPIVELVGINDFQWLDFDLPADYRNVRVGSKVSVDSNADRQEAISGEVIARSPVASAQSRTVRYRARLDSNASLPDNALIKLSVTIGEARQYTLPATAVLSDPLGDYVFILTPDSEQNGYRAQRRAVTVAEQDDLVVHIDTGLEDGEIVAARGAFKLTQGMLAFASDASDNSARQRHHRDAP